MTEETDGIDPAPADDAPVADPAAANEADSAPAQDAAPDNAESPDAGDEDQPPKRTPWFQKRIDELTAKRYEEQRRADYLQGQLEALTKRQEPEPAGPPTLEQYNWDEAAHQSASAKYYRDEARKAAREEYQAAQTEQQHRSRLETATQRLSEASTKHPDFADVVSDLPLTEAVSDLLVNDPNAAEVLYRAAKDPAEARRIFSLSPYLQAVELGKIAARLETPRTNAPKPIPPAPPQTVGGVSAGMNKTPEEMSMAEFIAWRAEQEKAAT